MARWNYANVLSAGGEARRLWQFSPNDQFKLSREYTARNGEALPPNLGGKSWRSLWQPKLNIAWLPVEKVFLRVVQLPIAEFAETVSMVEFQLEKLSPLPVGQMVWTIEVMPKREEGLQSVIIVIVSRSLVEEFLGKLEGQGYLADRLELPILDQLLATQVNEDGVWIYPGEADSSTSLVTWWYGGILRNVTLLSWNNGPDPVRLKEQLSQMAWAGELEGWLTTSPRWHLVADAARATQWEPLLNEIAGESVQLIAPIAPAQLAAMSAKRAVGASARGVNLLPSEFSERYRQQFIDRLWMRGLFATVGIYLVGLIIYFAALMVLNFQFNRVQVEVAGLSQQYTNTMQLAQRVAVLQEQANLKFGGLDCWKTISDLLPEELGLTSFNFQGGKTMMLNGTVAQEHLGKLVDYYENVGKASVNGLPLSLRPLSTPAARPNASGVPTIYWSFSASIGTTEK